MNRKLIPLLLLALTALACLSSTPAATPTSSPPAEPAAAVEGQPAATEASHTAEDPPLAPTPTEPPPNNENIPVAAPGFLALGDALPPLYDRAVQGVVGVRVISDAGGGQGSGFVVDMDGHIVTNFHVIEGAQTIEIAFFNGFKTLAEIIGTDLDSDLAVLKVDVPAEQLHPLPLGDSDNLRVGEVVVAIGNPFGLGSSMTVGIVSAKGRVLSSLNISEEGRLFSAGDLIQTDAAINPGNSGGPLLNMAGEVIGINRAIRTESFTTEGSPVNSGIGFSISVNILKRVLPHLIETGSYQYPLLGITSLPEITIFDQQTYNLPQTTGAYITGVTAGGPAGQAGVEVGDLITHIDGRFIIAFSDLLSYLLTAKEPGDTVALTILRGGETLEIVVTLGTR
jgi:2-alkenal reductase